MTYEIFLNVNCEQLTNRRIEIAGNTIQRGVRSEDHAVDAVCRSGGNDAVLAYSLSLSHCPFLPLRSVLSLQETAVVGFL